MKKILASIILIIAAILLVAVLGCSGAQKGIPQNRTANITLNKTGNYPASYGIEVQYCEGIGYTYEYRLNESSGQKEEYCRLTKDIECPAWAFVSGECHRELTLCSIKGHILKIGVEQHATYNATYPICIFKDGSYCKEVDFFNKKCHVTW
jgi:putative hemolysin